MLYRTLSGSLYNLVGAGRAPGRNPAQTWLWSGSKRTGGSHPGSGKPWKVSYANGDTYEGEATGPTPAQSVRHGYGVYTYSGGMGRFEGEFVEDRKQGWGSFFFENGDAYEGQWFNDRQHGRGVFAHWAPDEGILVYEGEFREGLRCGSGCLEAREMAALFGSWEEGKLVKGVQLEFPEPGLLDVAVVQAGEEPQPLAATPSEWQPSEVRAWLSGLGLDEAPELALAPSLGGAALLALEELEELVKGGQVDVEKSQHAAAWKATLESAHRALKRASEDVMPPLSSWEQLQIAFPAVRKRLIPLAELTISTSPALSSRSAEWKGLAVELNSLPLNLPFAPGAAAQHRSSLRFSATQDWVQDLEILGALRHPNLRPLLGVTMLPLDGQPGAAGLTMVYEAARGSRLLFELIHASLADGSRQTLDFRTEIRLALGICEGMVALTSRGITHGALCSVNVEIANAGSDSIARLVNCGTSWWRWGWQRSLQVRGPQAKRCALGVEEVVRKYSLCPVNWMAPEVLRGQEIRQASDVYSFGLLLWEMLFRAVPYGDFSIAQIVAAVGHGRRQLRTSAASSASAGRVFLHEVVDHCIRWDLTERPSFSVLLLSFGLKAGFGSAPSSSSRMGCVSSAQMAEEQNRRNMEAMQRAMQGPEMQQAMQQSMQMMSDPRMQAMLQQQLSNPTTQAMMQQMAASNPAIQQMLAAQGASGAPAVAGAPPPVVVVEATVVGQSESLRETREADERRRAKKGVLGRLSGKTEALLSVGLTPPKMGSSKATEATAGPRMVRLETGEWLRVDDDLVEQYPDDEEKWRALMAFRTRLAQSLAAKGSLLFTCFGLAAMRRWVAMHLLPLLPGESLAGDEAFRKVHLKLIAAPGAMLKSMGLQDLKQVRNVRRCGPSMAYGCTLYDASTIASSLLAEVFRRKVPDGFDAFLIGDYFSALEIGCPDWVLKDEEAYLEVGLPGQPALDPQSWEAWLARHLPPSQLEDHRRSKTGSLLERTLAAIPDVCTHSVTDVWEALWPGTATATEMFVVGCGALNAEPTQPLVDKGAGGLFIDRDEKGVKLAKHTASAGNRLFLNTTVRPGDVGHLLRRHAAFVRNVEVLQVDIDTVDGAVVQAALDHMHPRAVVVEVRDVVPFPIRYTCLAQDTQGVALGGANFAFWAYELQRRGYQLARLDSRDAVFVREEEAAPSTDRLLGTLGCYLLHYMLAPEPTQFFRREDQSVQVQSSRLRWHWLLSDPDLVIDEIWLNLTAWRNNVRFLLDV
ncbi:CTR1 [Symbiodinium sp. KB8]|nr:CTR1 [Symbiodinium sp. KB8]